MYKPTQKSLKIAGVLTLLEIFQGVTLASSFSTNSYLNPTFLTLLLAVFLIFTFSYKVVNLLGFLTYFGSYSKANKVGLVTLSLGVFSTLILVFGTTFVTTYLSSPIILLFLFLAVVFYIAFGLSLFKYGGVLSSIVKPLGIFVGLGGVYSFLSYFIFINNPLLLFHSFLSIYIYLFFSIFGLVLPLIIYIIFFFKASKVAQGSVK